MGLIELLPGDRIRRRAKRDFDWIQGGPIRRYFAEQRLTDFIAARLALIPLFLLFKIHA